MDETTKSMMSNLNHARDRLCSRSGEARVKKAILLLVILAGCAQHTRQSTGRCDMSDSELAEARAVAITHLDAPDDDYEYEYMKSKDYGDECGFVFDIKLRPEIRGYLLTGPAEVILEKRMLTYVETILIRNESR